MTCGKVRAILLSAILLISLSSRANSETATEWEPLAGSTNAKITAVASTPHSPDMAIVGYDNGNLYLTFEADEARPNWTRLDDNTTTSIGSFPQGLITAIAINPSDSDNFIVSFAGCHYPGKLWKTNDGGQRFTEVTGATYCDISSISINPVDPAIIYLIANQQLWVSDDYGNTWTQDAIVEPLNPPIDNGARISAVASAQNNFYSGDEGFLVGTTDGQVWMTLNGGGNWMRVDEVAYPSAPDLPDKMVTSLVFDDRMIPPLFYASFHTNVLPNDRDALWLSNGGESWVNIFKASLPDHSGIGMVSLNPFKIGTLYATPTTFSTVVSTYKSENNGQTWSSGCTCETGCVDAATESTGYFASQGAKCFAIKGDINGWKSWNTEGRDIIVNDVLMNSTEGDGANLPATVNDRYYFYFTEGQHDYAGWTLW